MAIPPKNQTAADKSGGELDRQNTKRDGEVPDAQKQNFFRSSQIRRVRERIDAHRAQTNAALDPGAGCALAVRLPVALAGLAAAATAAAAAAAQKRLARDGIAPAPAPPLTAGV